jgi:glycine C-acetyltransferase
MDFYRYLHDESEQIQDQGLWKSEAIIQGAQGPEVMVNGETWINVCANNYLGLSNHPQILDSARQALDTHGFGMSSVRFICGTQDQHKALEHDISDFLGTQDTILYSSCFDANGGIFETFMGEDDAIISDSLNHASIIDGIRLSKAKRYRYQNRDMEDLAIQLEQAKKEHARFILIVTDGVFSMDGTIAPLDKIVSLAKTYDSLVMVDDSHAVGFFGPGGKGTPAYFGVGDSIDFYTGTLGKALGGASGGYVSGKSKAIEFLRQRSRPYLFSNSLAPMIVASSRKALELVTQSEELLERLRLNTQRVRQRLTYLGYQIPESDHPIVPIMIGDATKATLLANHLAKHNILAVAFSYPVVPKGKARIRLQISAAHTDFHIDHLLSTLEQGKQLLD